MVSYRPLMILLASRGMSKRELMLKAGISANTMTKIRKNEYVALSVLTKICATLDVSYGDIVEYVKKEV